MKPDIQISREAVLKPIIEVAGECGFKPEEVEPYGSNKAKISLNAVARMRKAGRGALVLVSAITPTPAGEGKTTTTIGLAQALARLKKRTAIALREPSLGPCLGIKGGATGGGYSQVVPMEDINLHFTGDIHAVGLAHNFIGAVIDNHIYQWNHLGIDPRRICWRRVMDVNDRSLRNIILGLGGATHGVPRETGFDITAASEIMALLCLAEDYPSLKERLGRIFLGYTYKSRPVKVADLKVHGAVTSLLREAIKPNLVQTLEGVPAFVHGGPFANIAHGCNSVLATRLALAVGDYAITEAGFGFDLGAEKFFDIKCQYAGLDPRAVVLIATVRALKVHGGFSLQKIKVPSTEAVKRGLPNLEKHVENIRKFKVPVIIAVNRFPYDIDKEIDVVIGRCRDLGVPVSVSTVWAEGGEGGLALAEQVIGAVEAFEGKYRPLYNWKSKVRSKISTIAGEIYGARKVEYSKEAQRQLTRIEDMGFSDLPICMAKTQKSLSDDPDLLGRPKGFIITVQEIRIASGAGFLIPITGEILTMPGLPRNPVAEDIDIDDKGEISGLF